MKRKQGTETQTDNNVPMAITAYLLLYNVVQCIGWVAIIVFIALHYVLEDSGAGLYKSVAYLLNVFQFGALLEVVHAATGVVRSSTMITASQVASRVYLILILTGVSQTQSSVGVPMLLGAWTVTEVIRYSFYTLGLVGPVPYPLLWLRYTLFIILYPIGVTGELLVLFASLAHSDQVSWLTLSLPNPANISFSLAVVTVVVMLAYIPGFPPLYVHMFRQRRKIIGGMRRKSD